MISLPRSLPASLLAVLGILVSSPARAADDFKLEPGFVALFNGKDLTGWCYTEGAKPDGAVTDKFDGKAMSSDARYSAADGVLIVHPKTPRQIAKIWFTLMSQESLCNPRAGACNR